MKKTFKVQHSKRSWSLAEIAFLTSNANTMKDEDIADKLGRSLKSVREKRKRLDISKGHGRGHFGVTKQGGRSVPRVMPLSVDTVQDTENSV